jgi:hypothetical protein
MFVVPKLRTCCLACSSSTDWCRGTELVLRIFRPENGQSTILIARKRIDRKKGQQEAHGTKRKEILQNKSHITTRSLLTLHAFCWLLYTPRLETSGAQDNERSYNKLVVSACICTRLHSREFISTLLFIYC